MKFITLILIVAVCEVALSKESDYTIGLFGSYNWYFHDVNFQQLPGYPNCCPKFESGTGLGYRTGILLEHKLSDILYINSRMFYQSIESIISDKETTQLIQNNELIEGEFEHKINSTMNFINMSVGLGIKITKNLSIETGVYFSKNLLAEFNQSENISKPLNSATFVDSNGNDTYRRIRNEFSGTLRNLNNLIYGLTGKISYNLPLSKRGNVRFVPELAYHINLNDLSDDLQWQTSSFELGLSFKFTPFIFVIENQTIEFFDTLQLTTHEVFERKFVTGQTYNRRDSEYTDDKEIISHYITRTDTIFVPPVFEINANVDVVGVDSNNVEIPKPKFLIEQFIANRHQPLLNYIFFDSSSSSLPDKYVRLKRNETSKFSIQSLSNKSTLETYYHIMNIIGSRLSKKPNAKLTLVGCNSNTGYEKGNLILSKNRAIEIKNYLTSVWNINSNRITIDNKNLPLIYSYPTNDFEKSQENRRVEFYSNDREILEPVFISDTILRINPAKARFYINTKSDLPIKDWNFLISNKVDKNKAQFNEIGKNNPPQFIDYQLSNNRDFILTANNNLYYQLSVNDERNTKFITKEDSINFEMITIDKKRKNQDNDIEINKFNLILFNFTSSNISTDNAKIIDLVKSKIEQNSILRINGYTDRTGDSELNKNLSFERANSAYKLINVNDAIVEGLGEEVLLHDNDLPEGRFYSRTVEIIIETPIENK